MIDIKPDSLRRFLESSAGKYESIGRICTALVGVSVGDLSELERTIIDMITGDGEDRSTAIYEKRERNRRNYNERKNQKLKKNSAAEKKLAPSVCSSVPPSVCSSKEREKYFDQFWDVYPRKVSKQNAKDKFLEIVKDGVDPLQIIDAVIAQRDAGLFDDLQYTPHPSTWLNQRRWEDEIQVGTSSQVVYRGEITDIANRFRDACRKGDEAEKNKIRETASEHGFLWVYVENEIQRLRDLNL